MTKIEPQGDDLVVEQTSMVPGMGTLVLSLAAIQLVVAFIWKASSSDNHTVVNAFAQAAFLFIAGIVLLYRPVLRRTMLGKDGAVAWESKTMFGKVTRREGKTTAVEIDIGLQWATLYVQVDGRRHAMLTRTKMFTGERDDPELREQGTRIANFVGLPLS